MDKDGARHLQERFKAGIIQAQEMIAIMEQYNRGSDDVLDENISLHLRLIDNYSQSIAFIERHLNEPPR